ncbi:MAG: hypothetical protein WB698_01970 [Solirubrobacteraceae bacterium]
MLPHDRNLAFSAELPETVSLKPLHGLRGPAACLGIALAAAALLSAPASAGAAAQLAWGSHQPITAAAGSTITSISCTGSSLCAAVDGAGSVIAGDPHNGASWSALAGSFKAVSCASASLCVAVGSGTQDLAIGTIAGGFSPSMTTIDSQPITGVSCPSAALCVAVDDAGRVLSSTDSAVMWSTPEPIDGGVPLTAVSCASESLCVAVDEDGHPIASSDPIAAASWHKSVDSAGTPTGISCAGGFCVAAESGGALASSAPIASSWSFTPVGGTLTGVSCVASGLCVAVESAGNAQASDNPAGLAPGWSASAVGEPATSVSCVAEGFCAAGEEHGEVSAGQLPAPGVSTGGPTAVTRTSATISGSVNPQDVPLSSCRFEYGATSGYGQSTPCASTPGPGSAPVEVSAALAGLAPASTYNYRLRAASPTGEAIGADGTFTTAAPSTAQLASLAPTVSGVPADGDRLSCNANIHGGTATTVVAYVWWRDASPIAGANKQFYKIGPEDAGQHLQCEVIATDEAGSASARSAFVAVPAEGVPAAAGETTIGVPRIVGNALKVPISCSPEADPSCKLELRLTAVETLRGGQLLAVTARVPARRSPSDHSQPVTLLARKVSVPAGKQRTISTQLNATGRQLLSKTKRLSAQLTVEGTVIGVLNATIAKEQVSVAAPSAKSGRRAAAGRLRRGRRRR